MLHSPAKTMLRFLPLLLWSAAALSSSHASAIESCRHLGVVEIKVASEHCGYLDAQRKEAAFSAACTLADQQQEALQEEAREGSSTCGALECQGRLRRWQNAYTHVISKNCWTECGWAWVVDCEPDSQSPPDLQIDQEDGATVEELENEAPDEAGGAS